MLRRAALSLLCVLLVASTLFAQTRPPQIRTGIWRGLKVTYILVPGKDGSTKAMYQGDIILDHVQDSPNQTVGIDSVGVAYSSYLWPKVGGVADIPYTIDPASGDLTNLNTAISQFNSTFSGLIQLVPYTNQTDYVDFNFDPNNTSGACEAYEGRVGGEQVVGGSGTCTVATILHEMGHTVGVWHEQTRSDRNIARLLPEHGFCKHLCRLGRRSRYTAHRGEFDAVAEPRRSPVPDAGQFRAGRPRRIVPGQRLRRRHRKLDRDSASGRKLAHAQYP